MIFETTLTIPKELKVLLQIMHERQGRDTSAEQSVRSGTQISLMNSEFMIIRGFVEKLSEELNKKLPEPYQYVGIWSIRMTNGGHHVPHNHPKGWMSGVCYVEAPVGCASLHFDGLGQHVTPEVGKLVVFPSFLSHSTDVHASNEPRMTIAFDLERAA